MMGNEGSGSGEKKNKNKNQYKIKNEATINNKVVFTHCRKSCS